MLNFSCADPGGGGGGGGGVKKVISGFFEGWTPPPPPPPPLLRPKITIFVGPHLMKISGSAHAFGEMFFIDSREHCNIRILPADIGLLFRLASSTWSICAESSRKKQKTKHFSVMVKSTKH